MSVIFSKSTPEECGISSEHILNFLMKLENQKIPMHSVIIMKSDSICLETSCPPFDTNSLHRMFSITKSFVSLAIGLLARDHVISLDDHIIDYFPEKQPKQGPYKYTAMLTIKDMLTMRTCHDKTTYKGIGITDWVGSFFTTPPTHVPGTNFGYDTSSTHVLCALVEKLTGMELLDYLRKEFLDEIGFSKEAFIMKDPCGISMGGTGLCATPHDILNVLYLISKNGLYNGKQLLPEDYIKQAVIKQSDPSMRQATLEEQQGYGYQIWTTRNDGYVLYGMGGQLALYVPDKQLYLITTADTQGRQGGVQLIYDAFWDEIYRYASDKPLQANIEKYTQLLKYASSRVLLAEKGSKYSSLEENYCNHTYNCDSNSCGINSITLQIDHTKQCGNLLIAKADKLITLPFGLGYNAFFQFPEYDYNAAACAVWKLDNTLDIKIHIIDYVLGNISISLSFKDDYVTVMSKKQVEACMEEYNGIFSGKKSN